MTRVRLAVVGCGRIAEVHLRALRKVSTIEVWALADVDAAPLERLATRYAIERCYSGLDDVLNDPAVQAVAICLPPALHARAGIAVLASGKHLFLEKPATLTRAEGQELELSARNSAAVIQVGFHLRHHAYVRAALHRRSSGQLGQLQSLRTCFSNDNARQPQQPWQATLGGGVLMAVGVHHFDLWRFLTGARVEEVQAVGDDAATVTVIGRLSHGVVVSSVFSHVAADQNEFELQGDRERMRCADYRFDGLELQPVGAPPGALPQRLAGWARAAQAIPDRVLRGTMLEQAYETQWWRFAQSIQQGRGLHTADLQDGLWATEIALAAAESLKSHRAVRLDYPENSDGSFSRSESSTSFRRSQPPSPSR